MKKKDIVWHRDPAASGWRSRAFFKHGVSNEKIEAIAYDDGRWSVSRSGATTYGWNDKDSIEECIKTLRFYGIDIDED